MKSLHRCVVVAALVVGLPLAGLCVLGCRATPERAPTASAPPEPGPAAAEAPPAEPPPPRVAGPSLDATALALEQAWADALHRGDPERLRATLDDAFSITGVGSTASDPVGDKEEWLRNAQLYPWPPHEVLDVRVVPIDADAFLVKCLWRGDYPAGSLTERGGALDLLVSDVWVRRAGAFRVLSRHTSLPAAE